MKSWMMMTMSIMLITATYSLACTMDGREGFAPTNRMNIPIDQNKSGITEQEFHRMIDRVLAIYAPIVQDFGAQLNVIRDWENGTVNAFASRYGNIWNVKMFGGLS